MTRMFVLHPYDDVEIDVYDELGIAHSELMDDVADGDVVIPRHRAIPFGDFLEAEVVSRGAQLVNTYAQHSYISDSTLWRGTLRHGIPYWTEDDFDIIPDMGPFFVKGETNALKQDWDTYCYAEDKAQLRVVIDNNKAHPLLANQKIIVQPFLKFKNFGDNADNGQPVINEWRYFCYKGQIVASGFYWSKQTLSGTPDNTGAESVVMDTLSDIGDNAVFVGVDVAQLDSGEWKVIELNDGVMAGLCGVDGHALWSGLQALI